MLLSGGKENRIVNKRDANDGFYRLCHDFCVGFANVLKEGHVEQLVANAAHFIGDNKPLGALLMLFVGLLVTMGIGSSFSTIPIIATIFVPLSLELGFSPMATIALVGTAAALGDAGSPASDSTLGPTAGLNVDGQHNHIWDTCVPTFVHSIFHSSFLSVLAATYFIIIKLNSTFAHPKYLLLA